MRQVLACNRRADLRWGVQEDRVGEVDAFEEVVYLATQTLSILQVRVTRLTPNEPRTLYTLSISNIINCGCQ